VVTLAGCTKTEAADTADSSKMAAHAPPAATPVSASEARRLVDSLNTHISDAFSRGDAKALTALYATNAIGDFPGAPIATGADAIGKGFEGMLAGLTLQNAKVHADDVLPSGDLIVDNGTWSWTAQPKNGGKGTAQTGHYIVVWQHQADGTWKIARDYATVDPAPTK
jgi:ketosteroid isomerase-like protein